MTVSATTSVFAGFANDDYFAAPIVDVGSVVIGPNGKTFTLVKAAASIASATTVALTGTGTATTTTTGSTHAQDTGKTIPANAYFWARQV